MIRMVVIVAALLAGVVSADAQTKRAPGVCPDPYWIGSWPNRFDSTGITERQLDLCEAINNVVANDVWRGSFASGRRWHLKCWVLMQEAFREYMSRSTMNGECDVQSDEPAITMAALTLAWNRIAAFEGWLSGAPVDAEQREIYRWLLKETRREHGEWFDLVKRRDAIKAGETERQKRRRERKESVVVPSWVKPTTR